MHRNVVQIDYYFFGSQGFEYFTVSDAGFIELQAHHVQVVSAIAITVLPRQRQRQVRQKFIIKLGNILAFFDEVAQARHLAHAKRGLHVGHSVIVAQRHLLVVPRAMHGLGHEHRFAGDAVAAQQAEAGGEFGAVCKGHSAFGGGNDLNGVKAENGDVAVTAVANGLAFVLAANGMRGIFDNFEAIFLAQCVDGRHIAGLSCQVHRHDDFGQFTCFMSFDKLFFELFRAKIVCAGVDVHKVDFCTAVQGAVSGGDKGVGSGPEPVAGPKVKCQAGDVQSSCRVADGHGVPGTCVSGHALLELGNSRALGKVD